MGSFRALFVAGRLQAAQIQPAQIAQNLLVLFQRHSEVRGYFRIRRGTPCFGGDFALGVFNPASLPAQYPRAPIQLPETIENGAANTESRIRFQQNIAMGIEFIHRVNQPKNSSMNQVIERNVRRKAVVDAPRDIANLWKVFLEQPLALDGIENARGGLIFGGCSQHSSLPGFQNSLWLAFHRTTPRVCTDTVAGISAGERTTMRGRNGSSNRRRWYREGLLQRRIVELSAILSPTNFCRPSRIWRSGAPTPPAAFSPPAWGSNCLWNSCSMAGSIASTFSLRSSAISG